MLYSYSVTKYDVPQWAYLRMKCEGRSEEKKSEAKAETREGESRRKRKTRGTRQYEEKQSRQRQICESDK